MINNDLEVSWKEVVLH